MKILDNAKLAILAPLLIQEEEPDTFKYAYSNLTLHEIPQNKRDRASPVSLYIDMSLYHYCRERRTLFD